MFGSALLLVFGEALTQCVMSVGLPQDFIRTRETGISSATTCPCSSLMVSHRNPAATILLIMVTDAIKFPDVIHAVQPEPHNQIPQAQTAHDNAWDFMSLHKPALHMQQWLTSDRAVPRSYRMMQGFGVHTFRLINEEGKSTFVKYHWIPHLGTHSLVWDEALKVAGQDPDFHRRDLWDAIEVGAYPKWDLGVQLIKEEDEHKFDFDLLDATKLIPEELVPVQKIGTLTLNRNPVDYFSEVEQVAFCTQHIVPGMDFTDDPLLAGRNFSYPDTQVSRLGINWKDIPVNRPICPFMTTMREGQMSMFSKNNRTPYHPNRNENLPLTSPKQGGFKSYPAKVSGIKERVQAPKFNDHSSQATLFWNSMSDVEKKHIIDAYKFELSHCADNLVIQNVINRINEIDHGLATAVHSGFPHLSLPEAKPNHGKRTEYLSQITGKNQTFTAAGRKIGIFLVPGFVYSQVAPLLAAFEAAGCMVKFVGPTLGPVKASDGQSFTTEFTFEGCRSTYFDALIFAGGPDDAFVSKLKIGRLIHAAREAYMHLKAIGAVGNATQWLVETCLPGDFSPKVKTESSVVQENGVVFAPVNPTLHSAQFAKQFLETVANHRVWDREVSHIAA
ncbi:catalase [Cryptococcus neoformans]|nr:catalase [Cryptococcus neoformans var. grubii]OXC65513.1 catalase [Cryptococcus neoformans var. grubii MW-RSA852]